MATPVPLALLILVSMLALWGFARLGSLKAAKVKIMKINGGAPILFRPVFVYRDGWKLVSRDF